MRTIKKFVLLNNHLVCADPGNVFIRCLMQFAINNIGANGFLFQQIEKVKVDIAKQATANEQFENSLDMFDKFLKDAGKSLEATHHPTVANVARFDEQVDADRVSDFFCSVVHCDKSLDEPEQMHQELLN